ncbi:hypothetical protein [Methylobacterium sp. ARG-1]|uniref:hypothetical protein n=1 Tax=Methylobacterium sp. ARG-1 TaxID=1692501 RepID=UPI000680099E|nr:hypothetical protein [Methylobacterium sp. ARG-1]KNY19551.1 hypothetical protein AKJ13_27000 [Methylobacterium sp. ARG-1]
MSLQLPQGPLILAIKLRRRHLSSIYTACELLAVLESVLFLPTQRHACSRGRLCALGPFRVADPTGIAIRSETGDIFLEKRGASKS